MRQDDLLHRGRGMDCQAVTAYSFFLRLRARKAVCSRVYAVYHCNKYEWDRGRERLEMNRLFQDGEYEYFGCVIRGRDNRLAYIFEAETAEGTVYYSEEGIAGRYDHSTAYFNFFQYCFVHPCDIYSPVSWAKDACVYQIFPERFYNGTGEKDYITCPWDADPTPKSFYGGDLRGITQKLDYLSDLGVNCLYLTPVCPSPSNHKYDILNYRDVDPAFGGKPAMKELVRAAHEKGVRVILDGVFNHCSSRHPFFQDAVERGRRSPYYDWFFIRGERPDENEGNYSMFGAVRYMPRLNTGNPEVIRYFCDTAAWWIREFDIDGWRLDVCDEISERFLRALRLRVKQEKADALILGEIWHDPAPWLRGDMVDGVMNYTLTKACIDYIAQGSLDAQGFCDRLIRGLWRCPEAANQMALNLVGSHDTERFLYRVKGDREKLKAAYAAAFFMPGLACVYYGDEVGVTGGYDPGCRRGFPWEENRQDMALRRFMKVLFSLKKQPALMDGALDVFAENGMAVIQRKAPGQTARLYINMTGDEKNCAWGGKAAPGACRMFVLEGTGSPKVFPCE